MVDATTMVDDHISGIGHYTMGIVKAFDELAADGKLTYSLIVPRKWYNRIWGYDLKNFRKVIKNPFKIGKINSIMKRHQRIPLDWFIGRGYYYFPAFVAWPTRSISTVVIHDVTYLAVPETCDPGNRAFMEKVVPFSLKNARNVICVSEFSKSELIKHYHYDTQKISVASPSVNRTHFYRRNKEEINKVKAKYDVFFDNYILCVGNIEPRKNYERLVEAYTMLPKKITDKYPLVIIGAGGWNNDAIKEKIQLAKESNYKIIVLRQFVSDEDMPAMYSGAQFYVFTPVYEGFGMSPLEAYACGVPVVTSKVASLPEAAGNAAVYVDPFDVKDIARGMLEMFHISDTQPGYFTAATQEHLKNLSWRTSAEITASIVTGRPIEHFRK